MADIIQLLPDHVANQIAAGEVVQRPSSVVKELLENAIDAGAGTVKLIVKDGGKTLIQVVDDGIGMSPTDARLSFERHATSKIRSAEDLFSLHTKGFRGEALASIAAIAHVEMQTMSADASVGTLIKIEGSHLISQEVTATVQGTSISVKHLFFNIPARRNFLKSNQVELRHITDEFHRIALAHPFVSFHFYSNGSEISHVPGSNFRKRIVRLFGDKTNDKLVPVHEDTKVVKISGFICRPEFSKKSRGEQFFFVNNRFIRSPYLYHAVLNAYEGLIRADNYPGYFLHLEVPPSSIDINIHPSKTEIKFDDEQTLYAILRSTIKHGLGQFSVSPVLDFDQDPLLNTPYAFRNRDASQPHVSVDAGFNPFMNGPAAAFTASTSNKKQRHALEHMYLGLQSLIGDHEPSSGGDEESETMTSSIFEGQTERQENLGTTLQLGRKFILTTIKSGILILHQARAHQRVLYERFLRIITVKETISQQLLFPLKLSFNTTEINILGEMKDNLISLGFIFDQPEGDILQVTALPALIPEKEAGTVLDRLISEYQEEVPGTSFSQADLLAKTLAKTLAVKTGDLLETTSQMALVNDLFACKEPELSPFNKPIYITIPEGDLDRKFN